MDRKPASSRYPPQGRLWLFFLSTFPLFIIYPSFRRWRSVRSVSDALEFDDSEKKGADERERLRKLLNMSVNEIELSVRAANCLNNANITTVGELAQKTEADMLKYRNFGKKSLNEIKDKLKDLGLCLGYKFDADLLESKK